VFQRVFQTNPSSSNLDFRSAEIFATLARCTLTPTAKFEAVLFFFFMGFRNFNGEPQDGFRIFAARPWAKEFWYIR
jgi:hypothetical protein